VIDGWRGGVFSFLRERTRHEREHDSVRVRQRDQPVHGRARMSPMMFTLGPQRLECDGAVAGRLEPQLDVLTVLDTAGVKRIDHS